MNNPKISVIIPVYNVEQYLSEAVDSVLCQTFTDIEIILVDDGSTDASGIICDEYASIDSRIRVIHKSNGGLSSARNAGMSIMRGEFLMFLDSDDYWDSKSLLEELINFMDNNLQTSIIQFNSIWYQNGNYFSHPYIHIDNEIYCDNFEKIIGVFEDNKIRETVWDKFYRTSCIPSNLRFIEGAYFEDLHFILDLIPHIQNLVISQIGNHVYRLREGSIINSSPNQKKAIDYFRCDYHGLQFSKQYKGLKKKHVFYYLKTLKDFRKLNTIDSQLCLNEFTKLNSLSPSWSDIFRYGDDFSVREKLFGVLFNILGAKVSWNLLSIIYSVNQKRK